METASPPSLRTEYIIHNTTADHHSMVRRDILLREEPALRGQLVSQPLGLALDETAIDAALEAQEGGMVAVLDDASVIEDQDAVELAHRRQTVGDDQRRAATHQAMHGVLDQGLGFA